MAHSADPDQLASSEANWSGSTLFAKAGYIRAQQDKGFKSTPQNKETFIIGVDVLISFLRFVSSANSIIWQNTKLINIKITVLFTFYRLP